MKTTVVMVLDDGTEVWYEADLVRVVRDPHGLSSTAHLFMPGAPERPAGDYVEVAGASMRRIVGANGVEV